MTAVKTPAEIEAMAVELLGGPSGVVEFAREWARLAVEQHGPAPEHIVAAVNGALRNPPR